MTTKIEHPRFGEITVSKTRKARRISLSVRPPGRIRLSMPARCSVRSGLEFLERKEEWIAEALKQIAEKYPVKTVEPPYSTQCRTLVLKPADTDKISSRVTSDKITVTYPQKLPHGCTEVQDEVRKAVVRALRAEANEYLPSLTEELARQYGFRYNSVTIRATASRWGSCTARNDISLSLYLIRLPRHLIEYVIIHELCHTVHKNHSDKFYALLDSTLQGKEKALNKELKKYRPDIV